MKLPELFISQLRDLLPDEWEALADAITSSEPSVAVRVNDARGIGVPDEARCVPWCDQGFYLDGRPAFTFDPDWHAGRYYVQDASSMFIAHVIRHLVNEPVRYLDLCAAPGGKTTAAMQALPQGSLTVANEIVPPRARVLADNVTRWGNPRCVVTSNAPAQLGRLEHFFDVVATDVPCSGEGMMRKDDEAIEQWTPTLVEQCAQRQREILAGVWPALRPGGLLIYSTCTYNRQENELIAHFIINELGATSIEVPIKPSWNIHTAIGSDDAHCYRFMPHRVDGEGLFMAVFRKHGNGPRQGIRVKEKNTKKADEIVNNWLAKADEYVLDQVGDLLIGVPHDIRREVAALRESLNVLHAGVELATVMGRKTIPHHALAMSLARDAQAFPVSEVDYLTAVRYLRGESISIDAPRGHVLIAHEGAVLGFANNLGNRANNLYPKPLRILSTHAPASKPDIL